MTECLKGMQVWIEWILLVVGRKLIYKLGFKLICKTEAWELNGSMTPYRGIWNNVITKSLGAEIFSQGISRFSWSNTGIWFVIFVKVTSEWMVRSLVVFICQVTLKDPTEFNVIIQLKLVVSPVQSILSSRSFQAIVPLVKFQSSI